MIIAIPTNGTAMEPLFGKSMVFDIADVNFDNKSIDSIKTVNLSNPAGEISLPQSLLGQGVQVVVCGEITQEMAESLFAIGIQILSGAPMAPSMDLLNALIQGAVVESGCGCGGGGCGCEESDEGCGCEDGGEGCGCEEEQGRNDKEAGGGSCGCGSGCGCH